MIKPGTPVRCRNNEGNDWTLKEWYYIGVARSGVHVAEDAGGWRDVWAYVERMPRVLVKGDLVYVDNDKVPPLSGLLGFALEFMGMFEQYYVVKHTNSNKIPLLFAHAIHIDDIGE